MLHQVLPPLTSFALPPPPPPPSSISETSTRLSDLSTLPHTSYLPPSNLDPLPHLLPHSTLDAPTGYIPILPRTNSSSALFKKRCETCSATHDGSFGAGRFCSSRCARTVGGLAHRKKRMLERGAKAKLGAGIKKRVRTGKEKLGGGMMKIGALLNPVD